MDNLIYIPLYQNNILIKNSVELVHISQFINVLNTNDVLQQVIIDNIPSIMTTRQQSYICDSKRYRLNDLCSFDINDPIISSKLPNIKKELIDDFDRNIPSFYRYTGEIPEIRERYNLKPKSISVYGGNPSMTNILIPTLIASFIWTVTIWVPENRQRKEPIINTDVLIIDPNTIFNKNITNMRIVLCVLDIQNDIRFCIKYTNEPSILKDYKIEMSVYEFFNKDALRIKCAALSNIVQLYGCDSNTPPLNQTSGLLTIRYKVSNKKSKRDIYIKTNK